jgi:uncharacterized membrane protein
LRPLAIGAAAVLLLVLASPAPAASQQGNSLVVQVFSDGSALVTQRLTASQSSASVQVPLLSSVLYHVVAADGNNSPLSWKISGSNITVYTLGATAVTLSYDTLNLTGKKGAVWTIDFVTRYNTTVVLPEFSTLSYISGTPYSIGIVNDSPVATVPPGTWEISYGVSIGSISTTTSTSGGGGVTPSGTSWELDTVVVVVIVAGAVGAVLVYRWWRGRLDLGPQGADLRPDDVQVLNFIQEKGGKVLEPEIRMRFALPKTSAWRQIKRLERLGYLKVTKIGSQNQIELLKNREPGA